MPKKAAPDEIELSGETYRSMVEDSNDLIWVADAQGNFVYMNRRAEEVTGYSLDELKGRSFAPLIPKADLPRVQKIFTDTMAGKPARFEFSFYAKNGNVVTLLANTAPIVEKRRIVGVANFGQDITERKRMEEQVQKRARELEAVLAIEGAASRSLQLDEALGGAFDAAIKTLGLESGGVYVLEPDGKTLVLRVHRGLSKEFAENMRKIKLGEDVAGSAAAEKRVVSVGVEKYPTKRLAPFVIAEGIKTALGVPLLPAEKALGALVITSHQPRTFSEDEIRLLTTLGMRLGTAVNNAMLYEAAQKELAQRNRAEAELRESEARLFQAQRVAHLGSWDWDLKSDKAWWSDEMCRIFGVPAGGLRGLDESLKFMHPEDREAVRKAVADSLENKRPYSIDYRIVRPDGAVRFIHAQGEASFDSRGKPSKMVGTVQDVTKRKKAEEDLRLKEHLLDSTTDSVLVVDFAGNFIYVNEAAYRSRGYTRDELMAMNLHDLDTPEYAKLIESKIKEMQDKGEVTFESAHLRKDGSVMPVEVHSRVMELGGRKIVLGVVRDLTRRKQAEVEIRKLNESLEQRVQERTAQLEDANMRLADDISERMKIEEELKAEARILDAAGDSIFLHDAEGKFYYVNEAAYRDRGYTKEELLAINLHQFDVPEYAKLIEPRIKELMERGETTFESAHFRKDRSVMPVEVHLRLFDYKGKKLILSVARDISQRKKAQDELRRSEVMLSEAQRVAHVGSWDHDLATNEQHWSDEVYRILGRVPQGAKAGFDMLMDAVHPDDREPLRKAIEDTISGRKQINGYFRIVKPEGSVRTVYARAEVELGDSGKPARILGTVMDVTELKQAEELKKESEEKYRTIFENTRAATAIIEENTILSMVNPEFERVSGYSKAEIEGKKSWTEFIPAEDLEKMKEFHRLRRVDPAAVPSNYAFRFIDRQGNTRQAFMTIDLLPGTKRSIASMLDITERKKAEDKLKESDARLREAQSTAHLGSWEWDTRTNEMQWSDETYRILGLPAGSHATPDRFFDSIPIAERDVFRRLLDDAVRAKKPISVDYHVVRSDGSVRTVHWNVVAAFDKGGSPTGLSGTMLDVTDLKQAEAKLKKYAEELEEKLGLLESRGVQRIEFLVRKGNSYLIKEKRYENSTIVLYNLVKSGLAGICVTTVDPAVLMGIHGLKGTDCSFVWLSAAAKGENVVIPTDLEAAGARVGDLLGRNANSFVHLAGLEGIIAANGFDKSYDFLNSLVYSASKNGSRLIVAVNLEAMDAKQLERMGELLTEITDDDLAILGLKAPPKP